MDLQDIPARVADLTRHIGMQPPPVIVRALRPVGRYASFDKREGTWMLRVDPGIAALPGPVADGYLAHPLVAVSLGQPRRLLRRSRVVTLLGGIPAVSLAAAGVPLGWILLTAVTPFSLLTGVVYLRTTRQNLLEADRRVTELFGPGFLAPVLQHMDDNPPKLNGLIRWLLRFLPTTAERRARLAQRSGSSAAQ